MTERPSDSEQRDENVVHTARECTYPARDAALAAMAPQVEQAEGLCPHARKAAAAVATPDSTGCPASALPHRNAEGRMVRVYPATEYAKAIEKSYPEKGDGGMWRPKPFRVGVSAAEYVLANCLYWVMEFLNRATASDPNNKVSWDTWMNKLGKLGSYVLLRDLGTHGGIVAGLAYLYTKLQWLRCRALTDPYDFATNDTKTYPDGEPEEVLRTIRADGEWVADDGDPQIGSRMTRYSSNMAPLKARTDPENMVPSARSRGKLRWRQIDAATGEEITIPALILNVPAQWWIQDLFHDFGGNTLRDPICCNPYRLPRDPKEGWPGPALVDRTTLDPTRLTDNGHPTEINEEGHVWILKNTYGSTKEIQDSLRSFKDGKMKIDENVKLPVFRNGKMHFETFGMLPEDPDKPGIDKIGFNNNYNVGLSFLSWLKVKDHNAIADHLRYFNPDWDDEKLFQWAKEANIFDVARIHTIIWTEDLLNHPILQIAMHADFYGFLGQRRKMYLMRLCSRHPFINWLLTPLRNQDFIWGMAGSKWQEHGGPHQVPKQFRLVYRLHDMILGKYRIYEPGTNRLLTTIDLIDFIHHNTREVVETWGYEAIVHSAVQESCGALKLHNVPRAMTQMGFKNQQDGELTDICERDELREWLAGTGTYNQFRASVGEPPVESFMELTGGNAELAREIEIKFGGDINEVSAGIGILAQPKPAGFALGYDQFYEFIKDATRRFKCNRHFTEGCTYEGYAQGMDWVEHGGGMLGRLARHLPGLKPYMEGVLRAFAPWPDSEEFPTRMLAKTHADTADVFQSDLRTFVYATVAAGATVWFGVAAPLTAGLLLAALAAMPLALVVKRMLAIRYMQECEHRCNTDKAPFMFGTLYKAEKWINRAASFGRLQAMAVMGGSGYIAWHLHHAHPVLATLFGVVALTGITTWTGSKTFAADAQVLKVAMRNRMRKGQPVTDAASLPGKTALQKRYWFLKGDNDQPVATFSTCYRALKDSGLPPQTAFGTALLSVLGFGWKTHKGMSHWERVQAGFASPFEIYLPRIHQAFSESSTRIYARPDNAKGLAPGDVDLGEFEFQHRSYSPGRDYFTAYDFARMREGNHVRASREAYERAKGVFFGIGPRWVRVITDNMLWAKGIPSRWIGRMALKRRHDQLLPLYADRVVEEDRSLVPAISHAMYLRMMDGSAHHDLMREHTSAGDPSPTSRPTAAKLLKKKSWRDFNNLYSTLNSGGKIPEGDSQGKAFVLPGSILGKVLSLICNLTWRGKVVDSANGVLVNKILGMNLFKADVFVGESWFDGKDAVILDYRYKSVLAFFVRDELRQLQPGFYLGNMYVRLPFGLRFSALYFALDFRK